jgi:hypothetical protein
MRRPFLRAGHFLGAGIFYAPAFFMRRPFYVPVFLTGAFFMRRPSYA